jgi:hypothetical protein
LGIDEKLVRRYRASSEGASIPHIYGWISNQDGNKKGGPANFLYYAAAGEDELTEVFGEITAN